jgi:hypothetical protein
MIYKIGSIEVKKPKKTKLNFMLDLPFDVNGGYPLPKLPMREHVASYLESK